MTHEVRLGPRALDDLTNLSDYIADRAGWAVAETYVARIEAACAKLRDFPERGTPRDDLIEGLRTIAFERRATIAYTVAGTTVTIQRVLYGGRDLEAAFP